MTSRTASGTNWMSSPEPPTWKDVLATTPAVPEELLRWWLSDHLSCSLTTLPLEDHPSREEQEHFRNAAQRLESGEPIQYVCGRAPFRHLTVAVTPAVLIPRPETEQLVQWALDQDIPSGARILDVGTGSGCMALSLKQERPDLQVEGIDLSMEAVDVARKNAQALQLDVVFRQADLLSNEPPASWDILLSNPPYIAENERAGLPRNVRDFEPSGALFSGPEGLDHIQRLIVDAQRVLTPDGFLMMETGETQGTRIGELADQHGYHHQSHQDLAGRERFHLFRRG